MDPQTAGLGLVRAEYYRFRGYGRGDGQALQVTR